MPPRARGGASTRSVWFGCVALGFFLAGLFVGSQMIHFHEPTSAPTATPWEAFTQARRTMEPPAQARYNTITDRRQKRPSLGLVNGDAVNMGGPMDLSQIAFSAWVFMSDDPSWATAASMRTVVANKYGGCAASPTRNGYALYVNDWGTNNQHLVLEWGDGSSGCNKLSAESPVVPIGQWTSVGFSFTPGEGAARMTAALYIDGAVVASQAGTRAPQASTAARLGQHPDGDHQFVGNVTHATWWSAAPSRELLLAAPAPVKEPTVMATFPLTEAAENGKPAADASGRQQGGGGAKFVVSKKRTAYTRAAPAEAVPIDSSGFVTGLPKPSAEVTAEEKAASDNEGRVRAQKVKGAMQHAWAGYKARAWGYDELKPQSGTGQNNWGGMGCTLIDSLDTLWVMGMRAEFDEAKEWVRKSLSFGHAGSVSVFETTIRVLGGLLSAHSLSGDDVFKVKAQELADKLLPAFNTPSGIPKNAVNLRTGASNNPGWTSGSSILSELGTLQVEFRYLSHITGNPKYAQKVDHVYDVLYPKRRADGLYPIYVSTQNGGFSSSRITFGALGDSFYEYLLKVWLQGGKKDAKLLQMYTESMTGMATKLLKQSNPSKLSYIADLEGSRTVDKMDHLVCFMPGVLALGAHSIPDYANKDRDMKIAEALMYTCWQMYDRQPTGIAPEYVNFVNGKDLVPAPSAGFYILRPETAESLYVLHQLTGNPIYRDWGFQIFEAIERYCKTTYGYGALPDVKALNRRPDDRMESFFLAETLKYLYMLQEPDHGILLDKYVFNTEAHPMAYPIAV